MSDDKASVFCTSIRQIKTTFYSATIFFSFLGSTTYRSCTVTAIRCTSCKSHFLPNSVILLCKECIDAKKIHMDMNVIFFFKLEVLQQSINIYIYFHKITKHEPSNSQD